MLMDVIIRTFQRGATMESFDQASFGKLVLSIKKALSCSAINKIIIITNGDINSSLSEIEDKNGDLPSEVNIRKEFYEEVRSNSKIIIKRCYNWGKNPGSGAALNLGDIIAKENKAEFVLHWSPEMEIDNLFLYRGILMLIERNLSVVGFAREGWWKKPQWQVPQNTLAIYNLDKLLAINGFRQQCDFFGELTDDETISRAKIETGLQDITKIPIAGMEDFDAMLRMMKFFGNNFRWALLKTEKPLRWDTNFKDQKRLRDHKIKVFRQGIVMETYASDIFPERSPDETISDFFARQYIIPLL